MASAVFSVAHASSFISKRKSACKERLLRLADSKDFNILLGNVSRRRTTSAYVLMPIASTKLLPGYHSANQAKHRFRKHVNTQDTEQEVTQFATLSTGNRAGRLVSQTQRYVHCLSPLTYLVLIQVGRWPSSKGLQRGKHTIRIPKWMRGA